jgi:uncharacterized protein (TIGR02391 family)
MARRILDEKLIKRLAEKLNREPRAVGVMVSKRAAKLGISSEAALVVFAKANNIGTAVFQRSLEPSKQAEIRGCLAAETPRKADRAHRRAGGNGEQRNPAIDYKTAMRLAIDALLNDATLKDRCRDLLLARSKFDRAVNQATLVLEHRIREKAQPEKRLTGENLVNFAFNENLDRSRLRVASGNSDDQRGITQILRGLVPAFRNTTHHHIVDDLSREEAMRICGFIDVLLRVVDGAESQAAEGQ